MLILTLLIIISIILIIDKVFPALEICLLKSHFSQIELPSSDNKCMHVHGQLLVLSLLGDIQCSGLRLGFSEGLARLGLAFDTILYLTCYLICAMVEHHKLTFAPGDKKPG